MSLDRARKKYREFHLKNSENVTPLDIKIPRLVVPIGYGLQISYRSDKWNKQGKWIDYIHRWENKTMICVGENDPAMREFNRLLSLSFDLGENRDEVTYLGQCIDFSMTEDDRSGQDDDSGDMATGPDQTDFGSILFPFNPSKDSRDFVVCSPGGHIVYVISETDKAVYAFINRDLKVTSHGIEG